MSMADLWGNINPTSLVLRCGMIGLHFVVSHTDNIQLDNVDSLARQHCVLHPQVSHTDNMQLDNVDSLAQQHCVLHPHRR